MIRLLAGLALALAPALPGWAGCAPGRVELRGEWGSAAFNVEIADDGAGRAEGLMNRETLARSSGMLFVYDRPQRVAFWMHNTLIPLDMIFLDDTGTVASVHANARPLDDTSIPGGDHIQFVLEINGGLAGQLGIGPGSQMQSSRVGAGAAWPCE